MTAKPTPPPETSLLRLAREAAGLSPESAAARMSVKFSGSRWRQIEAGYRKDSSTQVVAPAPTLAQMAHTVGISSSRLANAGREDAAAILREIERSGEPAAPAGPQATLSELEEWQQQIILNALDNRPRSKREKALLLRTLAEQIERQASADNEQEDPNPGPDLAAGDP
ncbi:helix-turn-helix domain-containing protein [Streptomyces vilmorinianum]|uniref:helix-turn-helix domain-containing protein n=1 Tax=Streptomyces vilmorinianum TaxID=3051092 RepID=UPI0010FB5D64|nr:helix-turn-helix transcriptional regulator [Streptomyces vilmorinianum]